MKTSLCRGQGHAADFEWELVCLEYGAYIFLCSSCSSFERGEGLCRHERGGREEVRTRTNRPEGTEGIVDLDDIDLLSNSKPSELLLYYAHQGELNPAWAASARISSAC
jgi:hypothetical protein